MDDNIGDTTPTSLTRPCPFGDITNANVGNSRKKRNSNGCSTPTLLTTNLQEDGANLSVLELRRKRARERYASMSPKKKEARKMKAHVYKPKKEEESLRLNQTPNNYVKENEPVQSTITPYRPPFNETAPLGDITNVSADDLRSCHVNDCSTLQQRSNHTLLQSADTTRLGSVARRPMITPRHLPFTVINNVAHYDDMEHTGSPFSRILQGTTESS